jgi:DnaK suppressor protein
MPVKKKAATAKPAKKPAVKAAPKAAAKKAAPAPAKSAPRKTRSGAGDMFRGFTPYPMKKGEPYMNDPQRAHFREILRGWKRELMEEVDRTVHHMQDEAANFPDPNDRATQESEFSLELRTRDRERKLIKKIDEALGNLDANDYGYCETCGVEIGIRRLEARPTATQCIDCKQLDEIREKQMGG